MEIVGGDKTIEFIIISKKKGIYDFFRAGTAAPRDFTKEILRCSPARLMKILFFSNFLFKFTFYLKQVFIVIS